MADGDNRCPWCSRPMSEINDARHCERCRRRTRVVHFPSPDEETEAGAYGELQRSRDASPIPEASPMPNESAPSSALPAAVPLDARSLTGYLDSKIAALRDLLGDARLLNSHLEQAMTTLRSMNEGELMQLQLEFALQAQLFAALEMEVHTINHQVAVGHMLAFLQPPLEEQESSMDPTEAGTAPQAASPTLHDTDDEDDSDLHASTSGDMPRR